MTYLGLLMPYQELNHATKKYGQISNISDIIFIFVHTY